MMIVIVSIRGDCAPLFLSFLQIWALGGLDGITPNTRYATFLFEPQDGPLRIEFQLQLFRGGGVGHVLFVYLFELTTTMEIRA